MKTFKQCKAEVAKKYGLGETLVTGHMVKYFDEAAELYAESARREIALDELAKEGQAIEKIDPETQEKWLKSRDS